MDNTDANIASAPLPTANTLRARKNLIIQFGRFLAINRRWRRSSGKSNAERLGRSDQERNSLCVPR